MTFKQEETKGGFQTVLAQPMHGIRHQGIRLGPDQPGEEGDFGIAVETTDPEVRQPPLYRVVLLNDDYTPMEFVVHILEQFFYMTREKATQVMLAVHTQGKGVCGVYTKDIAETKAAMVNQYSRDNEHPLVCEVEEVDDE